MRVRINAQQLPEHDKTGTIIKEFIYDGYSYFVVNIDGYGYSNLVTGDYLSYPPQWLVAVPPEFKQPVMSTWEKFDRIVGHNVANTIIG